MLQQLDAVHADVQVLTSVVYKWTNGLEQTVPLLQLRRSSNPVGATAQFVDLGEL